MSRRHSAESRNIKPDPKYDNVLLARFINNIMVDGKKTIAEKIVYGAMDRMTKKYSVDAFETFKESMNNVKPYVEVKSVRVGGANYQVPSPVNEKRGYRLATRWIIKSARKRSGKSMIDNLADELFDAANNRGASMKTKEDTRKMAEANKAFSHFAQR